MGRAGGGAAQRQIQVEDIRPRIRRREGATPSHDRGRQTSTASGSWRRRACSSPLALCDEQPRRPLSSRVGQTRGREHQSPRGLARRHHDAGATLPVTFSHYMSRVRGRGSRFEGRGSIRSRRDSRSTSATLVSNAAIDRHAATPRLARARVDVRELQLPARVPRPHALQQRLHARALRRLLGDPHRRGRRSARCRCRG